MADLEAAQGILARDVDAMKGQIAALTDSFKDKRAGQEQILHALLAANARNLGTANANVNVNGPGGPSARQNVNQGVPVMQELINPAGIPNNIGVTQTIPVEDDQENLFGFNPFDAGPSGNQLAEQLAENPKRMREPESLVESMKAPSLYGTNVTDLCLVPGVVIPPKFKTLDFKKYKGTTCPRVHLRMFCNKMAAHASNDKLLMHCFKDSLSGSSLEWYMSLESSLIRMWKDLCNAFMRQYQYNSDLAPSRVQLQGMTKGEKQSFKD